MGDFLSDWSPAELDSFVPLLNRFGQWSDHTEAGADKFAADIALLAQEVAELRVTA
jgi:hypothetical protein